MKKVVKIVGIGLGVIVLLVGGAAAYAGTTANGKLQFPGEALPNISASKDPALIEEGRYLVHSTAHCAQCHSTDDREHPEQIKTSPLRGGLKFAMGPLGTRYAVNLTPHPTGLADLTDAQIARAVRTGVTHTGELSFFMRFAAARPSEHDLQAIISYLRSVEPQDNAVPKGEWYLFGKILLTYAFPPMTPRTDPPPPHVPPSDTPSVERGQYLAEHVMLCVACHSKMDPASFENFGPKAGGGLPDQSHGSDKDMEFVAPNLTSHPTGITGRLDEDTFVARIRAGRAFKSSIMPWENFSTATDADLRSVYRYLKSLPPVDNDVGPTYRQAGSVK